jgi:hypothetical protein
MVAKADARSASPQPKGVGRLAMDIGALIESSRGEVVQEANAVLTTLYWQIGLLADRDSHSPRRAQAAAR